MRTKFQALVTVAAGAACLLMLAADAQAKSTSYPTVNAKASNGYSILIYPTGNGIDLSATRNKKGAVSSSSYAVKGKTTKKKLKATLKGFGKVNLKFKAKGKAKTIAPPKGCRGPSSKLQKGIWKGKLKFKGEKGYTKINVKKAKGSIATYSDKPTKCKPDKPKPPKKCWGASGIKKTTSFSAFQEKGKKPNFFVSSSRRAKGVSISKFTSVDGGKLNVNATSQTALLKPQAPFSGTGNVAGGVLSGGLKVKLPGSTVKLDGFPMSVWSATC